MSYNKIFWRNWSDYNLQYICEKQSLVREDIIEKLNISSYELNQALKQVEGYEKILSQICLYLECSVEDFVNYDLRLPKSFRELSQYDTLCIFLKRLMDDDKYDEWKIFYDRENTVYKNIGLRREFADGILEMKLSISSKQENLFEGCDVIPSGTSFYIYIIAEDGVKDITSTWQIDFIVLADQILKYKEIGIEEWYTQEFYRKARWKSGRSGYINLNDMVENQVDAVTLKIYKSLFNPILDKYKEYKDKYETPALSEYEFVSIADKMDEESLAIIQCYFENPTMTQKELEEKANLTPSKIRHRVNLLREEGILIKVLGKRHIVINREKMKSEISDTYKEYIALAKKQEEREKEKRKEEEHKERIKKKVEDECASMDLHIGRFEDEPVYVNSFSDMKRIVSEIKEIDFLDDSIENYVLVKKYLFAKRVWRYTYNISEIPDYEMLDEYDVLTTDISIPSLASFLYVKTQLDQGKYVICQPGMYTLYCELMVLAKGKESQKTFSVIINLFDTLQIHHNYVPDISELIADLSILYRQDDQSEYSKNIKVYDGKYGQYILKESNNCEEDKYHYWMENNKIDNLEEILYKKYPERETEFKNNYAGYSIIWDAIPNIARKIEDFFASRNIDIKEHLVGKIMTQQLEVFPNNDEEYGGYGLPGLYKYIGNVAEEKCFRSNGAKITSRNGEYWISGGFQSFGGCDFVDWNLAGYILRVAEVYLAKKVNFPKKLTASYKGRYSGYPDSRLLGLGEVLEEMKHYTASVKSIEFRKLIEDALDEQIEQSGQVLKMYKADMNL